MLRNSPLVLLALLAACTPPRELPPAVPGGPVAWSFIATGSDQARPRARGFDGAVPVGATVTIRSAGRVLAETTADDRGRFDVSFDAVDTVDIAVAGQGLDAEQTLQFAVRDIRQAQEQAVLQRLAQTGSVPNHVLIPPAFAVDTDALALVVNSGDNTVDNLSLVGGGRAFPAVQLPDAASATGPVPAQPFAACALGQLAAVTRWGQSGITLFEISTGQIVSAIDANQPVTLAQPFTPAVPVDANNDGVTETTVTALTPRTLQGITAAGNRLFVTAANMLKGGVPPVYAPGMVVAYDVSGTSLAPANPPVAVTSFFNPQSIIAADNAIYVVETGVLDLGGGGWHTTSDGGIDVLDPATLTVTRTINLGRTAPGSAAVTADGAYLYVGSLVYPQVYKIEIATGSVMRGPDNPIVLFESGDVQSIFSLVAHPMGLIFASSFNTDQIYAVDSADDSVSPWPFANPLRVGEGGMAFGGAHMLALRPGRNGVDFRGADLVVLMSLAARIATVDTRYIMGP